MHFLLDLCQFTITALYQSHRIQWLFLFFKSVSNGLSDFKFSMHRIIMFLWASCTIFRNVPSVMVIFKTQQKLLIFGSKCSILCIVSENKVWPPKNIDGFLAFHHNLRITLILQKFVYFTCNLYFIYYHSSISLISTKIIDNDRENIALECRISMGSTRVN